MRNEDIQYVLDQYKITDLEININDFNSKVDVMVSESLERGGPVYEGVGLYVMCAEAELLYEMIEEHKQEGQI